ncbi:MAG: T9SS type A sorting domain-containing protein [Dysgonomonas sp.]
MKLKHIITVLLLFFATSNIMPQTPAFPGAEGGGKYVTGGRGGKVLYITSLEDNTSTGTLRWAINQSGARTIMFKVSGIIALKSKLEIKNANLTIAGQTAPGDGICIKDYPVVVKTDNVIIRFIRFRMGDETKQEDDTFWGREQKNIIVDHCSMSWSTDECASFYDNENFKMQWCILAESLRNSVHGKGSHGYGGIWGGKKASFHHNLLTCNDSRNPRFCGSRYSNKADLELVDFRNNVLYNWGSNNIYAGEGGSYNIVNNYFKAGPASSSSSRSRIIEPYADDGSNNQPAGTYGRFYIDGNLTIASAAVSADNWQGVKLNSTFSTYAPEITINDIKADGEFAIEKGYTHTAQQAYEKVLDYAGCSLFKDVLDIRYANEARNGTVSAIGSNGSQNGLIDTQSDAGGWPIYQTTTPPADSDADGIPDGWLDINYPGKKATDLNEERYTYLEVYINSLVQEITLGQQEDDNSGGNETTVLFCDNVPTDKIVPENLSALISTGSLSIADARTDACTENGYTWRTSDVTFLLPAKFSFSANFTSNGSRTVYVTLNGDDANKQRYDLTSTSCIPVQLSGSNTLRIESYGTSGSYSQFSMTNLCIKEISQSGIVPNINDNLFITIRNNTIYFASKQINIYSSDGKLLKSVKNKQELYIGDLPKGIYLIKLIDLKGGIHTQKYVRQ